jgi:MinD superfamily P-loop ATPase
MTYKIAIASGKGGTGKTTLAVNLFHSIYQSFCKNIQLVDCDVEEPNDHIFFPNTIKQSETQITQLVPEINPAKCNYCRKCAEYCEFNAIVVIPQAKFAEVNSSLCHSCGACLFACAQKAITEISNSIGEVSLYDLKMGNGLVEGRLKIGSAMQTSLIRELKKHIFIDSEIILYDAPPGTSCPVIETIIDTDYVILVTEPTPFGLHDLKLMLEILEEIEKPFGIVINKAGLGNNDIYELIEAQNLELLGEIPFIQEYASNYANGELLKNIPEEISESMYHIVRQLEDRIIIYEGNNYFEW